MALNIDFLVRYDKENVKAELQRIAKVTGKQTLSRKDIDDHGRLTSGTVIKKFGSLHHAHDAAGLIPGPFKKVSDRELLKILVDLWMITALEFGRSPMMSEIRKYGFPVAAQTIANRFGSWKEALMEAAKMASNLPGAEWEAPSSAARDGRPARRRRVFTLRKRFLVFRRDGYTCRMCKRPGGELQVDHVIPLCQGGSDRLENLQTLCRDCNSGKGGNLE